MSPVRVLGLVAAGTLLAFLVYRRECSVQETASRGTPSESKPTAREVTSSEQHIGEAMTVPMGSDSTRVLFESIGSIAAALKARLDGPEFAELAACRDRVGADCQKELSDAIRKTVAWQTFGQVLEEFAQHHESCDPSSIATVAGDVVQRSDDPATRTSALLLLDVCKAHASRDTNPPLPAEAYQRIGTMLETERVALLHEYASAPVEDRSIVTSIAQLASAKSERGSVRVAALQALEGGRAYTELNDALRGFPLKEHEKEVALVLARCGERCSESLGGFAGGGSAERMASLVAVARAAPSERARLLDVVRERLPDRATLTPTERGQLAYDETLTQRPAGG